MPTKPLRVPNARSPRTTKVAAPLFIQALLWIALTLAFAALLVLAGPQPWESALRFSALNWMPWVVLAPAVFWFSGKFPLERGHLWRSVPAHLIGCALCVAITVSVAAYFTFGLRPPRPDDRPGIERSATERDFQRRALAPSPDDIHRTPTLSAARPERPDRILRGERRDPYNRHGPFWWFFFGATLLRGNFDAAVYVLVAIAAHAMAFYRRAQEREQHAVALTVGLNRAKLDALRLQLQPHFLFNTLNAISALVHRDASAADELIGDLSELLRLSLQTTEHEVPLSRELELLDCYLAIERTRLGDRLRVVREIDPAARDAYVPTFVLQPIVENAVRHGIESRIGPGTVTITAQRTGENLRLSVRDDGAGLTAAGRGGTRRGIGLSNTEARLQALHGTAATLVVTEPESGGVDVQIILPYVAQPPTEPGTAGL